MSDAINEGQTPAEEDPVLHGLLASLPQPQPSHTMEDRVLSGVFRPAPRWVRRVRSALHDLNESGRIWMVVGGLAAGSVLPLLALLVGARAFAPSMGEVIGFTSTQMLPYVRASLAAPLSSLLETLREPIHALGLSGPEWFAWTAAIGAGCIGCSWGLYRTMTPRAARD